MGPVLNQLSSVKDCLVSWGLFQYSLKTEGPRTRSSPSFPSRPGHTWNRKEDQESMIGMIIFLLLGSILNVNLTYVYDGKSVIYTYRCKYSIICVIVILMKYAVTTYNLCCAIQDWDLKSNQRWKLLTTLLKIRQHCCGRKPSFTPSYFYKHFFSLSHEGWGKKSVWLTPFFVGVE